MLPEKGEDALQLKTRELPESCKFHLDTVDEAMLAPRGRAWPALL